VIVLPMARNPIPLLHGIVPVNICVNEELERPCS
jgi:hypothetical protein